MNPKQSTPTIHSGMQLPMSGDLAGVDFHHHLDLIKTVLNALLACKQIKMTERGASIILPTGGSGSAYIAGQWNAGQAYPDTTKGTQAIVFFQPDGSPAARTYYTTATAVPAGVSPDTGAPFWASFPQGGVGSWL